MLRNREHELFRYCDAMLVCPVTHTIDGSRHTITTRCSAFTAPDHSQHVAPAPVVDASHISVPSSQLTRHTQTMENHKKELERIRESLNNPAKKSALSGFMDKFSEGSDADKAKKMETKLEEVLTLRCIRTRHFSAI